jgi:DNA-binding LacI/PurR family transcriptional regulator
MTTQTTAMDTLLPAHAKAQLALHKVLTTMNVGDKLIPERVLAQHLGVSRPTVRRAVSRLCEQGVLEARQGSGTFLLRHMQDAEGIRKRTRTIGLLMPTVRNPMIAQMVEAIEQIVTGKDYRIVLMHDHGNHELQCQKLDQLLDHELDGLIVYPDADNVCEDHFVDRLNRIVKSGTPLILVDRSIPGVKAPSVTADNVEGMYSLTRHMLMHGRSRIAIISWGDVAGVAEQTRMEGFQRAMIQGGFEPTPILHATVGQVRPTEVTSREVVEGWLKTHAGKLPCDAIICFHDNMALGVYQAIRNAGLAIPSDIALAGYDNLSPQLFEAAGLSLTTVNQPVGLIGDTAARLLIDHLTSSKPLESQCIALHCDLLIRKSCGCSHHV